MIFALPSQVPRGRQGFMLSFVFQKTLPCALLILVGVEKGISEMLRVLFKDLECFSI